MDNTPTNRVVYEVSDDESEAYRLIEWHCTEENEYHILRCVNNKIMFSYPKECIDQSKVHTGVWSTRKRAEDERNKLIQEDIHEHRQTIAHAKKMLRILATALRGEKNEH